VLFQTSKALFFNLSNASVVAHVVALTRAIFKSKSIATCVDFANHHKNPQPAANHKKLDFNHQKAHFMLFQTQSNFFCNLVVVLSHVFFRFNKCLFASLSSSDTEATAILAFLYHSQSNHSAFFNFLCKTFNFSNSICKSIAEFSALLKSILSIAFQVSRAVPKLLVLILLSSVYKSFVSI